MAGSPFLGQHHHHSHRARHPHLDPHALSSLSSTFARPASARRPLSAPKAHGPQHAQRPMTAQPPSSSHAAFEQHTRGPSDGHHHADLGRQPCRPSVSQNRQPSIAQEASLQDWNREPPSITASDQPGSAYARVLSVSRHATNQAVDNASDQSRDAEAASAAGYGLDQPMQQRSLHNDEAQGMQQHNVHNEGAQKLWQSQLCSSAERPAAQHDLKPTASETHSRRLKSRPKSFQTSLVKSFHPQSLHGTLFSAKVCWQ